MLEGKTKIAASSDGGDYESSVREAELEGFLANQKNSMG